MYPQMYPHDSGAEAVFRPKPDGWQPKRLGARCAGLPKQSLRILGLSSHLRPRTEIKPFSKGFRVNSGLRSQESLAKALISMIEPFKEHRIRSPLRFEFP